MTTPADDPRLLAREQRRAWVRDQLATGLSLRELSRLAQIPASTLSGWSAPPPAGVCGCGAAKLHPASQACIACNAQRQTRWTPELLLARRDDYIRAHDGRPPASSDWNSTRRPSAARGWPPAAAVYRRFVSWEAFLAAPSPPQQAPRSPAEDPPGRRPSADRQP